MQPLPATFFGFSTKYILHIFIVQLNGEHIFLSKAQIPWQGRVKLKTNNSFEPKFAKNQTKPVRTHRKKKTEKTKATSKILYVYGSFQVCEADSKLCVLQHCRVGIQ